MSAAELLKEMNALPAIEREKLLFAALKLEEMPQSRAKKKRVTWPDVEERAKRIFGNRVLPNLVLLERDEEAA